MEANIITEECYEMCAILKGWLRENKYAACNIEADKNYELIHSDTNIALFLYSDDVPEFTELVKKLEKADVNDSYTIQPVDTGTASKYGLMLVHM